MESFFCIEALKAELERAYQALRSLPPGDDSERMLLEIERLERELLESYTSYVSKRDSTPPKKT